MSSLATITVVGFLGSNPETKQSSSGKEVTHASLAFDSGFGDNKRTVWCKLSMFGKSGETFANLAKKGSAIAVVGAPSVWAYKDRDGESKAELQIAVDKWSFVGKRADAPGGGEGVRSGERQSQQSDDAAPF